MIDTNKFNKNLTRPIYLAANDYSLNLYLVALFEQTLEFSDLAKIITVTELFDPSVRHIIKKY